MICKVMPPEWSKRQARTVDSKPEMKCLICGDGLGTSEMKSKALVDCSSCNFKVHEHCIVIYEHYFDKDTRNDFSCKKIEYQFRPEEILKLSQSLPNLAEIKYISVKPQKYEKRKRRYENPNHVCEYCEEVIPLTERDHYLICGAFGTPIKKSDIRNFQKSGFKRLRLMSKFREENFKVS